MQQPFISVNIPTRSCGHLVRDERGLFVPPDVERERLELLRLRW